MGLAGWGREFYVFEQIAIMLNRKKERYKVCFALFLFTLKNDKLEFVIFLSFFFFSVDKLQVLELEF